MQRFKTLGHCATLAALALLTALPIKAQTTTTMTSTTQETTQQPTIGARVLLETTAGNILVGLYNETPLHRDNFTKLAKEGFYNGTLFHRVIANFMVQGGDPDSREAKPGQQLGTGDPGYTIAAEFIPYLYHKRGALSAARTSDYVNPERRSSGSQFYIVWGQTFAPTEVAQMAQRIAMSTGKPYTYSPEAVNTYETLGGTPHLDGQYTVFGEVIEGLDIVGKIQGVKTDRADRPLEDIRIIRAIVQ